LSFEFTPLQKSLLLLLSLPFLQFFFFTDANKTFFETKTFISQKKNFKFLSCSDWTEIADVLTKLHDSDFAIQLA